MEKQRLDKIIASTGKWSRREVKALVRQGRVLVDGQWHDAMVNVGDNPTFANQETRLEAHLFRFQGDLYGKEVRVQLVARLRGEEKFPDLDRLQEQLRKDARNAQSILAMEKNKK